MSTGHFFVVMVKAIIESASVLICDNQVKSPLVDMGQVALLVVVRHDGLRLKLVRLRSEMTEPVRREEEGRKEGRKKGKKMRETLVSMG